MVRQPDETAHLPRQASVRERHLIWAAIALGLTSLATQVVLLREFLSLFHGNELTLGVVLANWMVLTGAGAVLGRFSDRRRQRETGVLGILTGLSLLPPASVILLRFLRTVVFVPGSMIGVVEALLLSFFLLLPYCLLSGFSFAYLSGMVSRSRGARSVASVYAWESLGAAAGGVVFSILLIALFETFQILAILLALDLALVMTIALHERHTLWAAGSGLLLITGLATMLSTDPDKWSRTLLFPDQDLLVAEDTPYGSLAITRQGEQLNFFENTALLFSTNDATSNEESVHYAMVQTRAPRRVLLVGGGISGTIQEILKYGVDRVDYVELNPWIIDIGRRYASLPDDRRVRVIADDARVYVRSTSDRYDAVLVNLPDPSTAQLNRYYTVEFFEQARRVLVDGGVVACGLLPGADYQGYAAREAGSVLYATMKHVFRHVLVVPGGRHIFLGSGSPLDIHIARLVESRGISTQYVNRFYIDDELLKERSSQIMATLGGGSQLNTDFRPICYYRQLDYWLGYFGFEASWLLLPCAAVSAVVFWRASPIGAGIFAGGLAASSLQVILLLSFQVLCGSLHQMTGAVVAAFMAGLAAGSGIWRVPPRGASMSRFIALQLAVAGVCMGLPVFLSWLHGLVLQRAVLAGVFAVVAFLLAMLVGMEFGLASALRRGSAHGVAAELYGLDLVGAAAGALIATLYALPNFGILTVSVMAGAVSAAGAGRCYLARKG